MFHYTQCGLDNIWLKDGYTIESTPYGKGFRLHNADALHRAIALDIVDDDDRTIAGQEARYLRIHLDLSQEALARLLDIDRATVIRWEHSREPLARVYALALRATFRRLMESSGRKGRRARTSGRPRRLVFARRQDDWAGAPAR